MPVYNEHLCSCVFSLFFSALQELTVVFPVQHHIICSAKVLLFVIEMCEFNFFYPCAEEVDKERGRGWWGGVAGGVGVRIGMEREAR